MDSERRHELETNDLKEFLDNFKDFWDKHGNKVLIVLFLGLGSYTGYNLYTNWQVKKANEASEALASATTAEQLLAVADEHSGARDEATRRAADLLLVEARAAQIADDAQALKKAADDADKAYKTLAETGTTVPYQLLGYEGLAKVAQAQGQWDQAKTYYETVVELSGETYLYHAARALKGIDQLPLLRNPIAFAEPAPAPKPSEGTDPNGFGPLLPGLDLPGLDSTSPGTGTSDPLLPGLGTDLGSGLLGDDLGTEADDAPGE